jgi:hypothetical protein
MNIFLIKKFGIYIVKPLVPIIKPIIVTYGPIVVPTTIIIYAGYKIVLNIK